MARPALQEVETQGAAPEADAPVVKQVADPGGAISMVATIVALLWIAGVAAVAVALLGVSGVRYLRQVELAALVAGAVLPALMAWFSGLAARDAARARFEAQRLADAADRLLNPEQSADEAGRKLAASVRNEISQLDRALEHTLARLKEAESMIAQQSQAVDEMNGRAKSGAGQMITGMEREREELLKISRDLTAQAQAIGDSISRHTRGISDAARHAEAEVRAADQALDNRLTSFGAAAALITDRTHALSGAAQASADSALRLETALSNALEVLAKATDLTDAARQSADAASIAANETAGAVRDTTYRAIDDAKRAADVIRQEAVGVEREAATALELLREAAEAARSAAIGARTAVEAETRSAAPARRERTRSQPAPRPRADEFEPEQEQWYDERGEAQSYQQPPQQAWRDEQQPPQRRDQQRFPDEPLFGDPPPRAPAGAPQGAWTWRDLLSNMDEDASPEPMRSAAPPPPRRQPAEDAVARLQHAVTEPRGPALPIVHVIEQAGLHMPEVFSASGLDRISQRARAGTQSRRRAVKDAAPEAVRILADYLAHNAGANQEAMQFIRSEGARISELLSRGRASMSAEATRAFLLIDSAAG